MKKKISIVSVIIFIIVLLPISSAFSALVPRDFYLEVAKGNIPGHTRVGVFGQNDDVGASWETIWCNDTHFPHAALDAIIPTQFNISSSSVNDDATPPGTGAWNVTIIGLDVNWVEQNETVQLNGQTQVLTALSYSRVNFFYVRESGTSLSNEGYIYLGTGVAAVGIPPNVFNLICVTGGEGHGRALTAIYSVPINKTAFLKTFIFTCDVAKETEFAIHYRRYGESFLFVNLVHTYRPGITHEFDAPIRFEQQTDIDIVCRASAGGGQASAGFIMILVNNDVLHNSTLTWGDGSASSVVVSSTPSTPDPTMIFAVLIGVVAIALLLMVVSKR